MENAFLCDGRSLVAVEVSHFLSHISFQISKVFRSLYYTCLPDNVGFIRGIDLALFPKD